MHTAAISPQAKGNEALQFIAHYCYILGIFPFRLLTSLFPDLTLFLMGEIVT